MKLNNLIQYINAIFDDNSLSLNLVTTDYEAAIIEPTPNTEIYRWGDRELQRENEIVEDGILLPTMTSRIGTPPNENAATHFFISAGSKKMFSPFISEELERKYSLCYPFEMYKDNLFLLLNEIPRGYYSNERIEYLQDTYDAIDDTQHLQLSVKMTGSRIMFGSKSNVLPLEKKEFFLENRYAFFEGDYTVILKKKNQMQYVLILIPANVLPKDVDFQSVEGNLIGDIGNQPFVLEQLSVAKPGENLLVFGAPGTGKSHYIKQKYEKDSEFIRIVFHEDYSYQDFVGCIKPIVTNGVPTYNFVPGPFTKILKMALENRVISYTLIIEELNRANAASVFGDVFQLLDRDENCISEYSIGNEDILNYLNENTANYYSEIRLPGNLSIVATMNSADQGVFPLDTAFKRRWNYEYMPIEFEEWHDYQTIPYISVESDGSKVRYISIRDYLETINAYLSTHEILEINEDRLIGPYYLKRNEWKAWRVDQSYKKLLAYLWDDVARLDRGTVFKEELIQFSHVCTAAEKQQQVFTDDLHALLKEKLLPYETPTEDGV